MNSDEAPYDLGGYVNKQNFRIWCTEKPTHPQRVTVCCGFWSRAIIGQLSLKNEQEVVTVNGDRLRAMLKEFLFTII